MTKWNAAIYLRLSSDDGDKLESNSITNQKEMITRYINNLKNIKIYNYYIDDGFTGTDFNRPGYQKMLEDIRDKNVNTIIIKDLSRIGRNYIEVGNFIDEIVPLYSLRFISINDNVDSYTNPNSMKTLEIPFKNLINESYAKDISKKIRSSHVIRKQNGDYIGVIAPFGYMKSNDDCHKLIIDPDAAEIVKRIFDLYVAGYGSSQIAEILTREELPTPVMYKYSDSKLNRFDHPEIWKHTSVSNIIKNRVYIGDLIQHRFQKVNYKIKKRKSVPESEWCIKENAHEPLVDRKTFEIAQSIKDSSNNYNPERRNVDYVLSDLVFCKDCGARMSISYDKKRDRVTMNCNNYRKFSKYDICFSHYINYTKLENTVYDKLSTMANQYINDKEEFENIIKSQYVDPKADKLKKIEELNHTINDLKRKQDSLYDDKFNNVISVETYQRLFNATEEDIKTAKDKLEQLQNEISSINDDSSCYVEYLDIIKSFLDMKNPTREIMNRLIDKIYVTKDKKLEIHYRIKKSEVLI